MSKWRLSLLALLVLLVIPSRAHAQSTQNFTIESFTANYYLTRDDQRHARMKVDEVVEPLFPVYDQNHGILRAIPESYKGLPLAIKIESVTSDTGQPYTYTTSHSKGNLVLKIGDKDRYVHGHQTYHIVYSLQNPISFYDDHEELYWDVNGTEWLQPFGVVEASLHIPSDIASGLQDRQLCYSGAQNSRAQDCSIDRQASSGETIVTTGTNNLAPGQNLSFIVGFNKGTFVVDKAAQRRQAIRQALTWSLVAIPPVLMGFRMYIVWRRTGRDPKGRGTIVPQYGPPKGFNSLTSDVMIREKLRNKAVTALLIELAIRKYLVISELTTDKLIGKKTDYQLELIKAPDDLDDHERQVIEMFFSDATVGSVVKIGDLKNKLASDFKKLSKAVPADLTTAGYFKADPVKAVNHYQIFGVSMIAVLFYLIFITSGIVVLNRLIIGLLLGSLVFIIFARYMSARTEKGVEAWEYLKGLKMYMQLAEADRLKYLQSPAGVRQWGDISKPANKLKLFEKLLPYAIILDIEKDWAKEFADVYSEAPDWYRGNINNFSTGYLIGSIGNFNSAGTTAFASPSSSSSSGFGGGGFSGGGGGGGGGGGW